VQIQQGQVQIQQELAQLRAQVLHRIDNEDARRRNASLSNAGQLLSPLVSVTGVAGPGIPGMVAPTPGIAPAIGQASPVFPATGNALRALTIQNMVDLAAF
jgi:hypothetical protein